ncbi:glycosyltransferase [Anaeromicropila populeti]|uniref:Glycosyltransferase involved in cell wall bisynthesis n=1 Tax=Anaeromicropila populeti TaxID=37658 RepID=A0A1I6HVI0_9FIRM|nr:glycosyltransferase [Anaeromicropila populeti]SFR58444.1 Glycosyltransferase involved in cell wall bisynthesis [Anaeromicropila populeti]
MKIKLLCCVEQFEEGSVLSNYLEQLDEEIMEVYLYTNMATEKILPPTVLSTLEEVREDEKDTVVFLTDQKELYDLIYRLYNQIFDGFLFIETEDSASYQAEGIYRSLLKEPITQHECLRKELQKEDLSQAYTKIAEGRAELTDGALEKYYYLDQQYYFFEPVIGKTLVVGGNESDIDLSKVQYMFYFADEVIEAAGQILDSMNVLIKDMDIKQCDAAIERMNKLIEACSGLEKIEICCFLHNLEFIEKQINEISKIWMLTYLIAVSHHSKYYEELEQTVLESSSLNIHNKYYMWNQMKRYGLVYPGIGSKLTGQLHWQLYREIYQVFKGMVEIELKAIPKKKRNKDLIFVFAYTFLGERHAPTRTILERCYALGKLLNKRIMLINTRESVTKLGAIPHHDMVAGNVIEKYNEIEVYPYKDYNIPFFQPDVEMPEVGMMEEIIEFVKKQKPYFILNIGGGSILADLCSDIVPVLSMAVAFSKLPYTMSKLSIIGRKLNEADWEQFLEQGYTKDNIIESRFTFDLIPKSHTVQRTDLKLPQDKFLIPVVGLRLDTEIDELFLQKMSQTFSLGTHFVFVGLFEKYEEYVRKFPEWGQHSTYVGYCNDMLALMEICNLYVNPKRLGGGFSVIEAFYMGVPGVSIDTGDVATAAGRDFCVNDYDEMIELIQRYITDQDFYQTMAKKAKERAKLMTDSAPAIASIIRKAEKSKYFF